MCVACAHSLGRIKFGIKFTYARHLKCVCVCVCVCVCYICKTLEMCVCVCVCVCVTYAYIHMSSLMCSNNYCDDYRGIGLSQEQ